MIDRVTMFEVGDRQVGLEIVIDGEVRLLFSDQKDLPGLRLGRFVPGVREHEQFAIRELYVRKESNP